MLSCFHRDYLADAIRSSELTDGYQKLSGERPRIFTATFLTAGCAIISDVNVGMLSLDMVTKLRTPAGRPACHEHQLRPGVYRALSTDFMQSIHNEGRGIRAMF
jgi:hypothetical protein